MKLRIKYCGGCNPYIDRPQLVREVIACLKTVTNVDIVEREADVGLIVGGCPVCCVNKAEIEDEALTWVVIGGTLINQVDVPASKLSDKICEAILSKIVN